MIKLLQCLIISDTYQPPICMTRCGHSFCQKCLAAFCQKRLAACPDSRDWPCPTCKHVHDCSVRELPRNFFAEQIVESFRAQPSGEFGVCKGHQQEITLRKTKKYYLYINQKLSIQAVSNILKIFALNADSTSFVMASREPIVKQSNKLITKKWFKRKPQLFKDQFNLY